MVETNAVSKPSVQKPLKAKRDKKSWNYFVFERNRTANGAKTTKLLNWVAAKTEKKDPKNEYQITHSFVERINYQIEIVNHYEPIYEDAKSLKSILNEEFLKQEFTKALEKKDPNYLTANIERLKRLKTAIAFSNMKWFQRELAFYSKKAGLSELKCDLIRDHIKAAEK